MPIREWRDDDAVAVEALLDGDADPLWAAQGHRLHGPPRDGDRWRRTLVGERAGQVTGAVTVARNPVHPARYNAAVEVAAADRGQGVAQELVAAARELRPEALPLGGKIRARDLAAVGLLGALGGRVYQRSLCPTVDPGDDAVTAWCRSQTAAARSLAGVASADLALAFADMYRWVHQPWSPVGSETALAAVSSATIAELDHELSAGVFVDGRLAAVAFAFRGGDGVDCVAETVRPDEPNGIVAVAAAIASCLTAAAHHGVASVEFDGHVDDPHLAPIVARLPVRSSDLLLLIEVP